MGQNIQRDPLGKNYGQLGFKNDQTMEIDLEIPVGMEVEVICQSEPTTHIKRQKHQLKKGKSNDKTEKRKIQNQL